jgi:hypothetical protein
LRTRSLLTFTKPNEPAMPGVLGRVRRSRRLSGASSRGTRSGKIFLARWVVVGRAAAVAGCKATVMESMYVGGGSMGARMRGQG